MSGSWPLAAPWTDAARARKAELDHQTREAMNRLDSLLNSGGAA